MATVLPLLPGGLLTLQLVLDRSWFYSSIDHLRFAEGAGSFR